MCPNRATKETSEAPMGLEVSPAMAGMPKPDAYSVPVSAAADYLILIPSGLIHGYCMAAELTAADRLIPSGLIHGN